MQATISDTKRMNVQYMQWHAVCDANQAAEILDVSAATVRRWARLGKIPYIQLPSGRMKFRRSDVEALLSPVDPVGSEEGESESVDDEVDGLDVPFPGLVGV